jgi:hypothetical protein
LYGADGGRAQIGLSGVGCSEFPEELNYPAKTAD